jgi:hypothetical protein
MYLDTISMRMLYTALVTLEDWAYVAATCGILALLHIALYPAFRKSYLVERTLLCGFILAKIIWFSLMILELAGVLDAASFIQALRYTYLGSYIHDTLTIFFKYKDLNKRFGSFYAAHHGLALAFLLPYTALFGSNPSLIEARALAIWSLENLLTDVLSLYRYTYGTPTWWDLARLPMILSLLLPAAAGLAYGVANINQLMIGTFHPATVLLTAAGVLMPLFSLYHQAKAWRVRSRVKAGQAGADTHGLAEHGHSSKTTAGSCTKLPGTAGQSKQGSATNKSTHSDSDCAAARDMPASREWLVQVGLEN